MGRLTVSSGASNVKSNLTGKNLLSEIQRIFPKKELPEGFSYNDLIVHVDGRLIDLNVYDIDRKFYEDVKITVNPKGLEAITLLYISIAISAVSVAASFILAPKIPGAQSQTDSPNNGVHGQRNIIRLDELEPNIYGNQRSYPDLIVNEGGAWEYVDNKKIVTEVFLIGIGSYETSEPKFEDTPFSDIDGQSFAYFNPGDIVPMVQGQFDAEVVDGQTLLGPNNDETSGTLEADSASAVIFIDEFSDYVNMVVPITPEWTAIFDALVGGFGAKNPIRFKYFIGQGVDLSCTYTEVNATGDIFGMVLDGGIEYNIDISSTNAFNSSCDGAQNFLGDVVVELLPPESQLKVTLPIVTSEVQVSFEFLRGLRGKAEIAVYVDAQGPEIRYDFVYESDTSNQLFFSEKISVVPPTSGPIEVRLVRFNDDKEDGTDTIQVSQVSTNAYRLNVDYGNRTILQTNRVATTQALRIADSKINAEVTRKTVTYSGGSVIPALTASRSFADAILHDYTEVFGLSPDDLPLDEMYQIDASLAGGLNFFDYTFADKEQSVKESLSLIANVVRCQIDYTGQGYEIYRNEARPPAAQFDSRNISIDSAEEISYRGAVETSNNGIKLKWKNPENNKYEYINYTIINGVSTECIHSGGGIYVPPLPTIPFDIDLLGCSTLNQAEDRADLECRSLIFIQKTLSTTVMKDGEEVSRGQVVRHSDYWQDDVTSGEISAINGDIFTTHNEIDLESGTYFVTYNDSMGDSFGPVPCTIIDLNNFQASMPEAYLANGYSIQSGTRYIISTLTEHENNLYVVNDKESNQDGTVTLELVQYDESIYPEED
jgi:hypothetical protein